MDEASRRPVTAALVGYGYWGPRLLGISERVDQLRITVVVDPRYNEPGFTPPASVPTVRDLGEVLADPDVEAVLVTTPATRHTDLVRQALEAGKHVFTEKPLTVSAEEAAELLDLARERRRMLTVNHQYWWSPEARVLECALRDGAVGKVVAVSAERAALGPVRYDVDALWDLAAHDLSVLLGAGVLGADGPEDFQVSESTTVQDGEVAGCSALTAWSQSGLALRLHACWLSPERRRRLVITGEKGNLIFGEDDQALSVARVAGDRSEVLSRTVKSDRGTPIESALAEFAAGARGTPHWDGAARAAQLVGLLEQLSSSARSVERTVRGSRCWL